MTKLTCFGKSTNQYTHQHPSVKSHNNISNQSNSTPKKSYGESSIFNNSTKAAFSTRDALTEKEHTSLLKSMISSADSFCIVTSFGLAPFDGEHGLSNSMASFLQGFAEKQNEPKFTAVFYYQKKQIEHCVYQCSKISINQQDWKKATDRYNSLVNQNKIDGNPIDSIKASLYILAGESKPEILAGQHNKFMINDRGMNVATGYSHGHRSKPSWTDSATIFYSPDLAKQQLEYFRDFMQPNAVAPNHHNHVTKIETIDGKVVQKPATLSLKQYNLEQDSIYENVFNQLDALPKEKPAKEAKKAFVDNDFSLGELRARNAVWFNNKGENYISQPLEKKPIGLAFSKIMNQAEKGDSIYIKQGNKLYLDSAVFDVLAKAARSDAKVFFLSSLLYTPQHQIDYVYSKFKSRLTDDTDKLKNIELKVLSKDPGYFKETQERGAKGLYRDHAKVYGLVKNDGTATFMSGSYNLDSQSVQRSHENLIFVEDEPLENQHGEHPQPKEPDSSLLYNALIKYYQNTKNEGLKLSDLHSGSTSAKKYLNYISISKNG